MKLNCSPFQPKVSNHKVSIGMIESRLRSIEELETLSVVANCSMNRERNLRGSNGYGVEIGFDPLTWLQDRCDHRKTVRWLDLCCGSGKALIQATEQIEEAKSFSIQITGVDLVGMFACKGNGNLSLVQCSVFNFVPTDRFDLITCVHGLHYLGDKLRAMEIASSWLVDDGMFVANLDSTNLRLLPSGKGSRMIVHALRKNGWKYDPAKHLVKCRKRIETKVPFHFRGADEMAGPNYTKQPAVDSYYE